MIKGRANFTCKRYPTRKCSDKKLPCVRRLGKKETRWTATEKCPHFVYMSAQDYSNDKRFQTCVDYDAVSERYGKINLPKVPCSYYKQFLAYAENDVIILNSAMWNFERVIGRMPKRGFTFLDEADLFLDSLTLRTSFSQYRLERLEKEGQEKSNEVAIEEYIKLEQAYFDLEQDSGLKENIKEGRISVFVNALVDYLSTIETDYTLEYLSKIKMLLKFDGVCAHIKYPRIEFFIPEPSIVWKDIRNTVYGKMLLMSATVQSDSVLNEVFGLEDYGYVEGETKIQGKIIVDNSYQTLDVNYKSWQDMDFQELYFKTLSDLVGIAPRPVFVQVHAKKYVPPDIDLQDANTDIAIEDFKQGKIDTLWSTKIRRGVDFSKARSCVFAKFPWPDKSNVIEAVMELKLGKSAYNKYYIDRAYRDFTQSLGRGLRTPTQVLHFYSPDITCHRALNSLKDRFTIEEAT